MIGRVFDNRYEVVELLGKGGMADVYRARDLTFRRDVAVKIIAPKLSADPRFAELFDSEATIAGNLQSAYITHVYDWGCDEGVYYLVMELVKGRSLKEELEKSGPMSRMRAAEVGAQVCQALATAHSLGVVHRDIKPSNIFLESSGTARVGDFGIAAISGASGKALDAAAISGTPGFMSPEQACGLDVDARSDIYSLAATLYVAITCSAPNGSASQSGGQNPRESMTAFPELNAAEDFDAILLKALSLSPEDRFASAGEMHDALRAYIASNAAAQSQSASNPFAAATSVVAAAPAAETLGSRTTQPLGTTQSTRQASSAAGLQASLEEPTTIVMSQEESPAFDLPDKTAAIFGPSKEEQTKPEPPKAKPADSTWNAADSPSTLETFQAATSISRPSASTPAQPAGPVAKRRKPFVIAIIAVVVVVVVVACGVAFALSQSGATNASNQVASKSTGAYLCSKEIDHDPTTGETTTLELTRDDTGSVTSYTSVSSSGTSYLFIYEYGDNGASRTVTRKNVPDNGDKRVTTTTVELDDAGRPVRTESGSVVHEYSYNASGQRISDKTTSGNKETLIEYSNGIRAKLTVKEGESTQTTTYTVAEKDQNGLTSVLSSSDGATYRFEYDSYGNLTQLYKDDKLIKEYEYAYCDKPNARVVANATVLF